MTATDEYVIHGDEINRLVDAFKLERRMLPGQVFEIIQKKLIQNLIDQIDKGQFHTVRFSNLEAIASDRHKDFLYAICGGLAELIDTLTEKGVTVKGAVRDAGVLPWNLAHRIDKNFKGLGQVQDEVRES